jgi:hypothetical protein
MTDILLASIQAETNGDVILDDLTALLDELSGSERERFLYFFVRPDHGLYHVYAHLSQFAVREPDWALAPDLIADEED